MVKTQLSNEELAYCRRIARSIRKAYQRYLKSVQTILGSKGVIFIGSKYRTFNHIDEAFVIYHTWREFEESLDDKEKKLLDDVVDGLEYFTKVDKVNLRKIAKKLREMGMKV